MHRADPARCGAVHRPHQRRLRPTRACPMRWPKRWACRSTACSNRPPAAMDAGQVGGLRARGTRRGGAVRRCSTPARGASATTRTAAGPSPGIGQFLPQDGASPAIGTVGSVEQARRGPRRGGRPGAVARAGAGRDAGRPPLRGTGVRRPRPGAAARRAWASAASGRWPTPEPLSTSSPA